MKKFKLTSCPYCGKKINPLHSWYLKNQGEFLCPKCGGISNIVLDPAVYILGSAAVIAALSIFLITRIVGDIFSISVFLWMIIPFFLFSVLCCFLVRLKKPILRKKNNQGQRGPSRPSGPAGAARPAEAAMRSSRPTASSSASAQGRRPGMNTAGRQNSVPGGPGNQPGQKRASQATMPFRPIKNEKLL